MKIDLETKYSVGDAVDVIRFEMDYHGSTYYYICKRKVTAVRVSYIEANDYKPEVQYLIEGGDCNMFGDLGCAWMSFIDDDNEVDLEGIYENRKKAITNAQVFEVNYKVEEDDKSN